MRVASIRGNIIFALIHFFDYCVMMKDDLEEGKSMKKVIIIGLFYLFYFGYCVAVDVPEVLGDNEEYDACLSSCWVTGIRFEEAFDVCVSGSGCVQFEEWTYDYRSGQAVTETDIRENYQSVSYVLDDDDDSSEAVCSLDDFLEEQPEVCSSAPLTARECVARINAVRLGEVESDPSMDSSGPGCGGPPDGVIGGPDFVACRDLPKFVTEPNENETCRPKSGRECVARLAGSWGKPAAYDSAMDANGDGIIGGPDFPVCWFIANVDENPFLGN